jgi:hydroxymethylpyrimidine pyrophosphatase-like HAD family hydrolase
MFFIALATDYDGTIAADGLVPGDLLESLKQFKANGRRLILVTGRELHDLKRVFPTLDIFDRIVAENGAILYTPATQTELALAAPPSSEFVNALKTANVSPLSVGRVVVATWEPNETKVLEAIKELGLELQIIFNKGAVMVLPPGVNKASGLHAALNDLGLAPPNVVGVGDAENDHAFLELCGCSAAVANALSTIKEKVDIVLDKPRGMGVEQLLKRIGNEDAAIVLPTRHGIVLGILKDGSEALLPSGQGNVLLAGHSAVGKSTIATALTERMHEKGLQFCVLDPEGDFEMLESAVQVGNAKLPPSLSELADLLKRPDVNIVVNALAIALEERPKFFADFLAVISANRLSFARPHWLIVDEAHHVLPRNSETAPLILPQNLTGTIFITVHVDSLAQAALEKIQYVIAAGQEATDTLNVFARRLQILAPEPQDTWGEKQVMLWDRASTTNLYCFEPRLPAQIHRRHTRKYAEGELGPDKSFYFHGPEKKLNLRAANLVSFLNIADGVDDGTWEFHRRAGDYSSWISTVIKDEELADLVAAAEQDGSLDTAQSRANIKAEIERRYTAPSKSPVLERAPLAPERTAVDANDARLSPHRRTDPA